MSLFRCPLYLVAVACFATISFPNFVSVQAGSDGATAEPVQLGIYYEVCCPFCQALITGTFSEAWSIPGFTEIANVSLVPFGHEYYNMTKSGDYNFYCQHGTNECDGNKYAACVRYVYNYDATIYVPFIIDVERKMNQNGCFSEMCCAQESDYVQNVSLSLGLDWKKIDDCFNSQSGINALLYEAELTDKLNPTLASVPWVVVNGNHSDSQNSACEQDILQCVCDQYQGEAKICGE